MAGPGAFQKCPYFNRRQQHENALYHQDNFLPDDYPGILYISYPDHNIIGRVLTVTKKPTSSNQTP